MSPILIVIGEREAIMAKGYEIGGRLRTRLGRGAVAQVEDPVDAWPNFHYVKTDLPASPEPRSHGPCTFTFDCIGPA